MYEGEEYRGNHANTHYFVWFVLLIVIILFIYFTIKSKHTAELKEKDEEVKEAKKGRQPDFFVNANEVQADIVIDMDSKNDSTNSI